jgi:hypothetical protein
MLVKRIIVEAVPRDHPDMHGLQSIQLVPASRDINERPRFDDPESIKRRFAPKAARDTLNDVADNVEPVAVFEVME